MPKSLDPRLDSDIYREVFDTILDGVYFVDSNRRIVLWNKGAERLSGYSRDEVVGRHCTDNILCHIDEQGTALCMQGCPLAAAIDDGQPHTADLYMQHKAGHRVPVETKISPLRDDRGRIVGAVEVFADASAKMAALERIDRLVEESLIDPLTRVGNRRYIEMTVGTRFDEMSRYGWPFALVICDIDRFKGINDTYGHAVGDEILVTVSRTLQHAMRSFDFVGRWGGEEFLICLPNIKDMDSLREIVERFRAIVAASSTAVNGTKLSTTVSFGATLAVPGDTTDSLFKRADELLYRSKQDGRNRVTVG